MSVEKDINHLILKVTNTGSIEKELEKSEESTGVGLENLQERLKINFGETASFDISENNNWVTANITLPIEEIMIPNVL